MTQVRICSPDKDLAQCVRGTRVVQMDRRRKTILDEDGFRVLLDEGPDRPAVICLSYTWCDDSLKWLPLSANDNAAWLTGRAFTGSCRR